MGLLKRALVTGGLLVFICGCNENIPIKPQPFVDRDGRQDVLTCIGNGWNGYNIYSSLKVGDACYTVPKKIIHLNRRPDEIQLYDYNEDGTIDIGYISNGRVYYYLGQGNEEFRDPIVKN